jgi:hypothetical protein
VVRPGEKRGYVCGCALREDAGVSQVCTTGAVERDEIDAEFFDS